MIDPTDDRPLHKGYPSPYPDPVVIPRKFSTRPCSSGNRGLTDAWVGFAIHSLGLGPFVLCPACLNWHDPEPSDSDDDGPEPEDYGCTPDQCAYTPTRHCCMWNDDSLLE